MGIWGNMDITTYQLLGYSNDTYNLTSDQPNIEPKKFMPTYYLSISLYISY